MLRKSRILCILLALSMILSMLAGCTQDGNKEEAPPVNEGKETNEGTNDESDYSYHWKLATTEPQDYYMVQLSQKFIDEVNERTGGKVTGEVFASGQLGNLVGALEGLDMGNVDIVMDGISSLSEVDKMFNVFGIAYLYDSKDHQYNFWDNNFEEVTDIIAEESGYRLVTVIDGLNRNVASKKPLNNLQDFQGLKIRVPTITSYMRVWELLGTAPIAMSLNEVYSSLQTGVIEAQENDIAMTNNLGFYEVAPYAVMAEHVPYEASLYFSEKTFKSYPEELQQIILEVGNEIMLESREMISKIEKESLAKMEKDGVTIIRPDLTEFREATKGMRDEYSYAKPILDLIDKAKSE